MICIGGEGICEYLSRSQVEVHISVQWSPAEHEMNTVSINSDKLLIIQRQDSDVCSNIQPECETQLSVILKHQWVEVSQK